MSKENFAGGATVGAAVFLKTKPDKELRFDKAQCIICQRKVSLRLTSTEAGQKRVKEAAEIRKDEVYERLKLFEPDDKIMYHSTNECYKSYTLEKTLKSIKRQAEKTVDLQTESHIEGVDLRVPSRQTRSALVPRSRPSAEGRPEDLPCVVCGHVKVRVQQGTLQGKKYRISECNRANTFLAACAFFKDVVYDRIPDLNSEEHIFAADLYAHENCIRTYIRKYETANTETREAKSSKFEIFQKANEIIEPLLNQGYGFTLTDIRELMMSFENLTLQNSEIKIFLVKHYGSKIKFSSSDKKNEPLMVFSSEIGLEVLAAKIRSNDAVRGAAEILREALRNVDFGIEDKFCDATELKNSWETTAMPEVLLTFFSALFNVKKSKLFSVNRQVEELGLSDENELIESSEEQPTSIEWLRMFSLFQIMFYNLHHGSKKTPLHLMTAHAIYDKCKGKELITSMNKIGTSTSYNELMRNRNLLSAYAIKSCEINSTPIPSHFSHNRFTMAAFDNFDFEDSSSVRGTYGTHDTAVVLFQEIGDALGKPSVKDTALNKRSCKLVSLLPCQRVRNYNKRTAPVTLPPDFQLAEDLGVQLSNKAVEVAHNTEFIINLAKCGLPETSSGKQDYDIPTWSGIHALISSSSVPLKKTGFLPVIPAPVTDYATVYTALKNFQNVREQVNQDLLPVFCDEGVFRVVADIMLALPHDFTDLYPMMGMFHLTKVALRCAGRYLSGCGMDDALIECEVFGAKTVQSVIGGTHYYRSFHGMLIVSEVVQALQWEAFWCSITDQTEFKDQVELVEVFRNSLRNAETQQSQLSFNALLSNAEPLRNKFEAFIKECSEKSEVCKYWDNFLGLVELIKHLVCSDREGNWLLHVQTLRSLISVFHEFDCTNYLRYGSWYLERILKLEVEYPPLFEKFMEGHFVVQETKKSFCAVAPDMKLEQTIQRSQKSSGGIVGQTRKSDYVAQWELVYHEVIGICDAFRELTGSKVVNETTVHHDLTGARGITFNRNVFTLLEFVKGKGNPYKLQPPLYLHNFVTQQIVPDDVKARILNFRQHGEEVYATFRHERFILKGKPLSHTIQRNNLRRFDYQSVTSTASPASNAFSKKDIAQAQRDLDVARERGEHLSHILSHDLFSTNPLFDGDDITKSAKHVLISELEKQLPTQSSQLETSSNLTTAVIVDFMSQVRMVKLSSLTNMAELVNAVIDKALFACSSNEVHFIFDSYVEHSLKEAERIRRASTGGTIELATIHKHTPVPVQENKFWSSSANKTNLELLAREEIKERSRTTNTPKFIASGAIAHEKILPAEIFVNGQATEIPHIRNCSEEADHRCIPHVGWAVQNGAGRVTVLSNDTDVVVLLLRYCGIWLRDGLQELWVAFGRGENRRFIPLHTLYGELGNVRCKVLVKAHVLTGDDVLSKIGTKTGAIKVKPEEYLQDFAETDDICSFSSIEKYLVRVWKQSSKCDTFDELRLSEYRKSVPLSSLPPTSHCIQGHILRAFYVLRQCLNLLNNEYQLPDPTTFGWEIIDGVLRPSKFLKPLPSELLRVCSCQHTCATLRCQSCNREGIPCTTFCRCNQMLCQNRRKNSLA